jgi:long-chain acyl-CoA synthetase
MKIETYIAHWPDIDYPNFIAWMKHGRDTWNDRVAIRYRAGKNREFDTWTYGKLFITAENFARSLAAGGCVSGDRVALWAENRPEWCAAWLGAVIAGCTVVPIDFTLHADAVDAILAKTEPKALILSSRRTENLVHFKETCPSIALSAVFDQDWPALLAAAKGDVELPSADSIAPDHSASIIFTSGTTGIAKGVTLSHHGIIANINASIMSLPIYDSDVFMGVLPLHHTYPTTCAFLSPLSVGASLTICEKVVGKVIVDDIRDSGGTIMIAVPILYDKLKDGLSHGFRGKGAFTKALVSALCGISRFFRVTLRCHAAGELLLSGVRKQAGLGTIRLLVSGGGPLDPATADFFDDLGFNIEQGYGMSENGPLMTTNTIKHKNNASAGLPVKYTEIRIIDAAEDGIGEIAVKSPSLMLGYFRNPEATAQCFTADGFLKTGDLGRFDAKGFLFITGRLKNLIVTAGGKNVYPEEIEAKFASNPLIAQTLVLPRQGDKGEEIAAVFVPNAEYMRTHYGEKADDGAFVESQIRETVLNVNRTLAPYQKITSWGIRPEPFEETASRKIRRFLYKNFDAALNP